MMHKFHKALSEHAKDTLNTTSQTPLITRSLSRRGLLRIAGAGSAAIGLSMLPTHTEAGDASTATDDNQQQTMNEANNPERKQGALILFIIRHAEKPYENWPGPGLTEEGQEDKESLVIRGWERVGAWAALFGSLGGTEYLVPRRIYAARPGPLDQLNRGPSRRPAETITALADRLGLTPILKFEKGQEAALMAELLALSGVVLVAWEHKAIVEDIIPKIAVHQGTPPTKWPEDRFDVVLRFDRSNGQSKFAYRALYPQLLSGDSNTPL